MTFDCWSSSATWSNAERLWRSAMRATREELGQQRLTASFGVTQAVPGERTAELLVRADKVLDRTKPNGCDRVEVETP